MARFFRTVPLSFSSNEQTEEIWNNCTPAANCRVPDREWLLYRDYYLELKEKIYTQLANQNCGNACPVGQKLNFQLPGSCPVAADFSLRSYTGSTPACTGSQTILLTRDAGPVGQAVTVDLYYPPAVDNPDLTHTFVFAAGESQKSFCVPDNISLSSVLIKSAVCGSGGSNTGSSGSGNVLVEIINDRDINSSLSGCGDISTFPILHLLVTLKNSAGNTVVAPNPITLVFSATKKQAPYYSSSTNTTISLSINTGQSTAEYEYMGSRLDPGNSNCTIDSYNIDCLLNISGATEFTSTSAVPKCSNFTATPYTPPVNNCPAVYAYKKTRFPDVEDNFAAQAGATNQSDLEAQTKAEIKAQGAAACASMADIWIERLQPGLDLASKTAQQITNLRNGLLEVCTAGSDINHPFGASTRPVTSAVYLYNSFGDVILSTLNLSNFTPLLNPWLIDAPYPYTPQQQSVVKTISNTNADICTKLNSLTQLAAGANMPLYNYLVATFPSAMTITATELAALQKSCNNCRFVLPVDISLPVFLDGANSGYATYSDYVDKKANMNSLFNNALSASDANYGVILSNFMNQAYGFSLTYDDYLNYEASVSQANPAPLLVNTLPYGSVPQDAYDCVKNAVTVALSSGKIGYDNYIAENRRAFRENYINTCKLAKANAGLTAVQQIYHYTLYYYDQADNLVRTIPPEGVTLFDSKYFRNIDQQRDYGVNPQPMNYNGPAAATSVPDALLSLSQVLSAPQGAVAMWFYNDGSTNTHFIETTSDEKYTFQVTIANSKLDINVFPMNQTVANGISFVPSNAHYQANISAVLPLDRFMHIVFQGNSLGVPGTPELYLNGTKLTVTSGSAIASPYGFSIKAANPNVILPDNLQSIKHMLLYDHVLPLATIKSDASQLYFAATELPNKGWYRFNVPPAGGPTTVDNTTNETVLREYYNAHTLPTTYAYNSTNQVSLQLSPDGGSNRYWYDLLSRLVISQNDKQYGTAASPLNNYSYTQYDVLGRITEVGQKNQLAVTLGTADFLPDGTISQFATSGQNSQITRTWYDVPAPPGNGIASLASQNNLRKRVAASTYADTQTGPSLRGTYYDYDLDGNVRTLWQQISGLPNSETEAGLKRIDYEYDLISGKVNLVRYQDGQPDQFYYSYLYDAENRLKEAWTGRRAIVNALQGSYLLKDHSRLDASYNYYLHGPLSRTETGDVYGKVQGTDYAYTLQGWLKGVNSTAVTATADIGGDGGTAHPTIAKDAYGYNLYYHNTDYTPVTNSKTPFAATLQTGSLLKPLFNGNIAGSSVNIPKLGSDWIDRTYRYDQLNRILSVKNYHSTSATATPAANGDYDETFTYDGNGNILTLNRTGAGIGSQKDVMAYNYNRDAAGKLVNNQLRYLSGTAAASGIAGSQADNNYLYDNIGNLTADVQAGITGIEWSVYGKIRSIAKGGGGITYAYDAGGNRVSKIHNGLTTYYIRDAQGNTLAVYDNAAGGTTWREQHLYGSSRLGMWQPNVNLTGGDPQTAWQTTGLRQYELSNHLGNIMATITDKRLQHTGNNTAIDYYEADISTAQDYYAFGSQQPGRSFAANSSYRYGFNGKENDNDVGKGTGNQQDYGMRIYDGRVGRFLSVDPLSKEYPALTPYQFASNSPIAGRDRDGLEFEPYWATTVPQKIREYETQLRKDDPKNADAIIRQHNINAFLFVGGALTAGSGSAATAFWDIVMAGGTARALQGIANHNKTQTSEGVHIMFGAAMGELGGTLIGKTFEVVSPLIRSAGKSLTGTWVKESISGWSENAVHYQEFITGVKAGQTFEVNGYNFDGFRNGVLLDAKSGLGNFVDKQTGTFKSFFKGQESLVIQARNQLGAANGTPIEWNFEIKAVRDAMEKLFEKRGVKGISLKYTPKK